MAEWTDEELRGAVDGYLWMLGEQEAGRPYSKSEVRRGLLEGVLSSRTKPSVEFRMRNISAVLDAHGRAIVVGYVPAGMWASKLP